MTSKDTIDECIHARGEASLLRHIKSIALGGWGLDWLMFLFSVYIELLHVVHRHYAGPDREGGIIGWVATPFTTSFKRRSIWKCPPLLLHQSLH